MVTDTAFLYSNDTRTVPPSAPADLRHVAGVGSSPVVNYEGTGAYFLDRLDDGIWRLELYPDVAWVHDPFTRPSLEREAARVVWRVRAMRIDLPDLGQDFAVRAVGDGDTYTPTVRDGTLDVRPGVYLLTRSRTAARSWSPDSIVDRPSPGGVRGAPVVRGSNGRRPRAALGDLVREAVHGAGRGGVENPGGFGGRLRAPPRRVGPHAARHHEARRGLRVRGRGAGRDRAGGPPRVRRIRVRGRLGPHVPGEPGRGPVPVGLHRAGALAGADRGAGRAAPAVRRPPGHGPRAVSAPVVLRAVPHRPRGRKRARAPGTEGRRGGLRAVPAPLRRADVPARNTEDAPGGGAGGRRAARSRSRRGAPLGSHGGRARGAGCRRRGAR